MSDRPNLPDTSKSAYKLAKKGMIEAHKQKIKDALGVIGIGNYEVIAAKCGLERHQVGRRLGEMEKELVVFKPGSKSKTKNDRMAYEYCLTSAHTLKVEHPATMLINKTKEVEQWFSEYQNGEHEPKSFIQTQLF